MSIQAIQKLIRIPLLSAALVLCGGAVYAQDDADTTSEKKEHKVEPTMHQLSVGVDVFHPALSYYRDDRESYEFYADYYIRKEFYGVAEGGWGSAKVNYPDLAYSTNNEFLRIGFNKNMLTRYKPNDWDMMFMGLRAAVARVHRSEASYMVLDSLWGNVPGVYDAQNFAAVWAEVTAGMRVELLKGFFAGWNIRGKFLLNGRSFKSLAPEFIAGYGRGDKGANFDFNVYLSYGIRWGKTHKATTPPKSEVHKD